MLPLEFLCCIMFIRVNGEGKKKSEHGRTSVKTHPFFYPYLQFMLHIFMLISVTNNFQIRGTILSTSNKETESSAVVVVKSSTMSSTK